MIIENIQPLDMDIGELVDHVLSIRRISRESGCIVMVWTRVRGQGDSQRANLPQIADDLCLSLIGARDDHPRYQSSDGQEHNGLGQRSWTVCDGQDPRSFPRGVLTPGPSREGRHPSEN